MAQANRAATGRVRVAAIGTTMPMILATCSDPITSIWTMFSTPPQRLNSRVSPTAVRAKVLNSSLVT